MISFTSQSDIPDEFWELLERLCESRLDEAGLQRLEQYVIQDRAMRSLYVDYMALHGTLHWDAAMAAEEDFPAPELPAESSGNGSDASNVVAEGAANATAERPAGNRSTWAFRGVLALSACLLVAFGAISQRLFFDDGTAERPDSRSAGTDAGTQPGGKVADRTDPPAKREREPIGVGRNGPRGQEVVGREDPPAGNQVVRRKPQRVPVARQQPIEIPPGGSSLEAVVAFVDHQVNLRWNEEGVQPSNRAADGAWLRRVTLDIVGRIPTAAEVERFLADDSPDKRRETIDRLLDDPQYVRNWTTIWSNLLVGRRPSRDVDRPALEKFLRDSFARNRPWKDIVVDLVSAEGDGSRNGAANFLIAHLNNEAVPATAITARLFLGTQVQCTQCHNHPFNSWKQSQFWELNGCFQQAAVVKKKPKDRKGKPRVELVNRNIGGPIFYPKRNELLMAAFPKFEGRQIDASPGVNRRAELSRLMFESDRKLVARSMVNRMWAHFFGHGFTRRVDDMGPHSPASHPKLLDRLADEFVHSGYDLKRLIRWICNSRPYQLSSRFNDTNHDDNPAAGLPPAFSRMYVKAMTAEQLYDSLMIATQADRAVAGNWDEVARKRNRWLQQFVIEFNTDENDEATTFDGTIPQALMLMNSRLVQNAVSAKPGTYLHRVLNEDRPDEAKVRMLALAALSREPTPRESAAFHKALSRSTPRGTNRRQTKAETLEDIFWAFLNSNEFILIH